LTRPSHTSDEALYDLRRAILIATMLAALGGGNAAAQSSLQLDPLDEVEGNSYDILPAGVFATEDGCSNLWRMFSLTETHPPDFLVYSPSGVTGANFKCVFQDDAKPATSEGGVHDPEWTVTGNCEGRDLASSETAKFTVKQMSGDDLHITRKLKDIMFAEDFGTFVRCPKA
jgi:hypothetical protein